MGVVCKMFIQSATEQPDGTRGYQLGVVCRGDENKSWAAATPTGTMKCGPDALLDAVWEAKRAGTGPGELEVLQVADPEGGWLLDSMAFSYGGCQVKFRQKDKPWGTLELGINAEQATHLLRRAFADSLLIGKPATFAVTFR